MPTIHEPDEHLLYLTLCWRSNWYISAGYLIISNQCVYASKSILWYFLCIQQLKDVNPWSWDGITILLLKCRSDGEVRLVYTDLNLKTENAIEGLHLHLQELGSGGQKQLSVNEKKNLYKYRFSQRFLHFYRSNSLTRTFNFVPKICFAVFVGFNFVFGHLFSHIFQTI